MSDEAKTEEKPAVDLTKDAAKVLEMVEKLSVLDLANLVKAMEDKFGVSAAAPVAVAAAGPAAGGEAGGEAEEKSAYNIELKDAGSQKIAVIKVVREITQLGLKEAKDLVDAAPKVIKEDVKTEEAQEFKKKLEEAGATVDLV